MSKRGSRSSKFISDRVYEVVDDDFIARQVARIPRLKRAAEVREGRLKELKQERDLLQQQQTVGQAEKRKRGKTLSKVCREIGIVRSELGEINKKLFKAKRSVGWIDRRRRG